MCFQSNVALVQRRGPTNTEYEHLGTGTKKHLSLSSQPQALLEWSPVRLYFLNQAAAVGILHKDKSCQEYLFDLRFPIAIDDD
jgi:hypothetical protein